MNCKPGDLAVYVAHHGGLLGRLFEVIEAAEPLPMYAGYGAFWRVKVLGSKLHCHDEHMTDVGMRDVCELPDCCLRPIRPDEEPMMVGQLDGIKEAA